MKKILQLLFAMILCFTTQIIIPAQNCCKAAEQIEIKIDGSAFTWEGVNAASTQCVFNPPLPVNSLEIAYDGGCIANFGPIVQNQNSSQGISYQGIRVRFTAPPQATGEVLEARVVNVVNFGEAIAKFVIYNGDSVEQGYVVQELAMDGSIFQIIDLSSIGFVPGPGNDFYIAWEPGGDICSDGYNAMGAAADDTSPDGRSEQRYGDCTDPWVIYSDRDNMIRAVVSMVSGEIIFDIKPDPLNLKCKGVMPAAILGTDEFDVRTIDPDSLRLTREGVMDGVSPIRYNYTDKEAGDILLKFRVPEVVEMLMLNELAGQTIPLTITGETVDGAFIRGQDTVRLLGNIDNECYSDFDCDADVDGSDAITFKDSFGRSSLTNPCSDEDPCDGDFDKDRDVDGNDAHNFKSEFGTFLR